MLNQVVIVGRLTATPEVKELESGKKVSNITLAVSRSYKNADGIYETDFINCVVWEQMVKNVEEYCHKGDVLGIKGRLQTREIEKEDGSKTYKLEVIAEKISVLSSKKEEE